jgi:hypothetical protein
MRHTLGTSGRLTLSVGVLVRGIDAPVVVALRGGGMTWRGDGAAWRAGHRLLGGRWCGVAVVGQVGCSVRRGRGC